MAHEVAVAASAGMALPASGERSQEHVFSTK
jgi:hypothetical protein